MEAQADIQKKYMEDLSEKEQNQIRKDKDKFVKKLDELIKTKDKTQEAILKELYARFVEKTKARLQKARDVTLSKRRMDMMQNERTATAETSAKVGKNVEMLKGLNATLVKNNMELQDTCRKIITRHQEERKKINEDMQEEIKTVQKEMEEEVRRKALLSRENEEMSSRIKELKEMFRVTSENVERTLGKSEFDMEKLEEQLKNKIEAETTKLVVILHTLILFSTRMTRRTR